MLRGLGVVQQLPQVSARKSVIRHYFRQDEALTAPEFDLCFIGRLADRQYRPWATSLISVGGGGFV
jgi:hypothetical protein